MAAIAERNKTFLLVLTRHGSTTANQTGLIQGQQDVPLSDEGKHQSKLLGQRLSSEHYTHVFSSDLTRASETAKLVKVGCASPIILDSRLRERYFGVAQGKPKKTFVQEAKSHGLQLSEYTPTNAELPQQFSERVIEFFKDLCQTISSFKQVDTTPISSSLIEGHDHQGLSASVFIVTHGGTARVLLDHFKCQYHCEFPRSYYYTPIMPNASVCVLLVTIDSTSGHCVAVKCISLYSRQHLE